MNAELCNCGANYGLVTVTMTVGGNTVRAVCQVLVTVTEQLGDNKCGLQAGISPVPVTTV